MAAAVLRIRYIRDEGRDVVRVVLSCGHHGEVPRIRPLLHALYFASPQCRDCYWMRDV